MKKLLICILLLTFMAAGCTSKNSLTLKGDIQNNIVSAVSTVSGKIIQMNYQQGEPVKKGDIIAVIDSTSQKYAVGQLQAVVDMKKAKLAELQAGTRPNKLSRPKLRFMLQSTAGPLVAGNRSEQIAQGKISVSMAQEAVDSAQITYDYNKTQYTKALELFKTGALSQNDLDAAKLKSDTAETQLATAKLQLESAKAQLNLLQNGVCLSGNRRGSS